MDIDEMRTYHPGLTGHRTGLAGLAGLTGLTGLACLRTGQLVLLIAVLAATSAEAQQQGVVDLIENAYRQFEYEEAERLATEALARYGDFTAVELTEMHTYLALIAYIQDDLERARGQFTTALQLDPDLELDPVLVPPRIQEFFAELRAEPAGAASQSAHIRYLPIQDRCAEAALRSMLLPGWGQLHKGHETKGFALGGLFAAATIGSVVAQRELADARSAFERALGSPERSTRYDTYQDWKRRRNAFGAAVALVWAASYVDALLSDPPRRPGQPLALRANPSGFSLQVHF